MPIGRMLPQALLPAFASARYLMDRQSPTLLQTVVAEFIHQGHFAAHIRRMREAYREQRDALAATLRRRAHQHIDVQAPDQGMHLIAHLNNRGSDTEMAAAAQRAGIFVRAVSRFYRAAPARAGLLIGFSGFPRSVIIPAAARLATVVAEREPH